MKLYYFKDPKGDFGDDLNPWLFNNLLPGKLKEQSDHLLIGVGTLLNHRIPDARRVTVFGSGHGYGQLPRITTNWNFICVRGPLTAKAMNLDENIAITDPAMLTPLYFTERFSKAYDVSYMPHCDSAQLGDWQFICNLLNINFIDPRQPFLKVFEEIQKSKLLITEAMHGAILADAFRVPWCPVKAYPHISEFKWQDWLMSVNSDAQFSYLPSIYRGDELYGFNASLKNKVKRVIVDTVLWNDSWSKPPHAKSNISTIENCADELQKIIESKRSFLSSAELLEQNTERLLEKLQSLRNVHV